MFKICDKFLVQNLYPLPDQNVQIYGIPKVRPKCSKSLPKFKPKYSKIYDHFETKMFKIYTHFAQSVRIRTMSNVRPKCSKFMPKFGPQCSESVFNFKPNVAKLYTLLSLCKPGVCRGSVDKVPLQLHALFYKNNEAQIRQNYRTIL